MQNFDSLSCRFYRNGGDIGCKAARMVPWRQAVFVKEDRRGARLSHARITVPEKKHGTNQIDRSRRR